MSALVLMISSFCQAKLLLLKADPFSAILLLRWSAIESVLNLRFPNLFSFLFYFFAEGSFYFSPPNRYVFPGAEVFDESDDDSTNSTRSNFGDSSSTTSDDDDDDAEDEEEPTSSQSNPTSTNETGNEQSV